MSQLLTFVIINKKNLKTENTQPIDKLNSSCNATNNTTNRQNEQIEEYLIYRPMLSQTKIQEDKYLNII